MVGANEHLIHNTSGGCSSSLGQNLPQPGCFSWLGPTNTLFTIPVVVVPAVYARTCHNPDAFYGWGQRTPYSQYQWWLFQQSRPELATTRMPFMVGANEHLIHNPSSGCSSSLGQNLPQPGWLYSLQL